MAIPLEVIIERAGATTLRLTPSQQSLRYSTNAIGGFASCSFDLPGSPVRWKREIPQLATVKLVLDTYVVWEGQVEDLSMRLGAQDLGTSVQCFGPRRRLDEVSVRRIWSKRDLSWKDRSYLTSVPLAWSFTDGNFDQADLTRSGIKYQGTGNGALVVTGVGHNAITLIPETLVIQRVMGTFTFAGAAKFAGDIEGYNGSFTSLVNYTSTQNFDLAVGSNYYGLALGVVLTAAPSYAPLTTDSVSFENLRLLCTSVVEDASGGFYGGSILTDLIALVPGLSAGVIESGSDYTIQALERAVRNSARSVVDEVAGYYTREWSVWEGGRFDWKSVNRDEPQWIATIAELQPGSELTSTVDTTSKTIYVLYVDAADQREKEASATAVSQANPWVKQGRTKDLLVSPGFGMTTSTSAQLASRMSGDLGSYPAIQGRIVLPAARPLRRVKGPSLPALQIRAGQNILIPDLPKTELFTSGRDGETLFHIVSTEVDLDSGLITLDVEGQGRDMDILLARLAASTRTLTG